ncbi:MAG: hypothetical protein AAB706_04215 [Patescibacteria group bacterium]
MAENEIRIILNLDDKATKELMKQLGITREELKKLSKQSKETDDSLRDQFKEAGKSVRDFRQTLIPITITIAAIVAVTQQWAKHNTQTRDAFDSLTLSVYTLTSNIGSIFAPAVVAFSVLLRGSTDEIKGFFGSIEEWYTKTFEAITFLTQYEVAYHASRKAGMSDSIAKQDALKIAFNATQEEVKKFTGAMQGNRTQTTEAEIALRNFAEQQNTSKLMFISGGISAQEYYNAILLLQENQIAKNQITMQQMNEMAALTAQLRDQDLMEEMRINQEKLALLQFYKQEFMLAHQGMAAFTVVVGKTIQTSMTSALTGIITGAKTAKEAFKELGMAMVQSIVNFMVQKLVAFVLEKTLLAGSVTAARIAGAAIYQAYAPAAVVANIATLGAAGVAAAGSALLAGAATVAAGTMAATGRTLQVSVGSAAGSDIGEKIAIPRARGGDDIVTRPTLFLAGEGGPERATFIPLGSRNQGGAGEVNIYIANATMDSTQSIAKTAEELGFLIERNVRAARGI